MTQEDVMKIRKTLINEIIHYCDKNIIELLERDVGLKPYETINKMKFDQLQLVREFMYAFREKENHKW